ncbi:MAG: DEAD/DEAH box helicase [Isosphaeraceae bacterium]|nr:DEAD/DEAH box helicase [Isosphaeraceae bacterium]
MLMQRWDEADTLSAPVRSWFDRRFPDGPTPAQRAAWPIIARGENLLLISPTGTGKTLAAFLAIIDELMSSPGPEPAAGPRCLYISPLKSLGRDVARNLAEPLEAIAADLGLSEPPIRVGVRTGDTSAHARAALRKSPPHLLVTTPESLSLMMSQASWRDHWKSVEHVIIDEVHSLVPNKRGADLAVSLERLTELSGRDPIRIGLSATCRPAQAAAQYLVGPSRECAIVEAPAPPGAETLEIDVETLLDPDASAYRPFTYRRLLRRLGDAIDVGRTTLVFANTRAFTEKLTHDLRLTRPDLAPAVAAHHGSLEAERRHEVEHGLQTGSLRGVVTSTSLELGVDIGRADLAILVGLPGSTARCLQRVGRAGHDPGSRTRGLILASTHAEVFGAAVLASQARNGRIEPIRPIENPLDVLCQQLIAFACLGEWSCDRVYEIITRSAAMAALPRRDFDECLAFLAGELAAPPGAFEPEAGSTPRWTSPRIWKSRGLFGIRNRRVMRWFWGNVGTIASEESTAVQVDGRALGRLESDYADSLQPGDRFVLDGRALICKRHEAGSIIAVGTGGEPALPIWRSDRAGLTIELARELAEFRAEAADRLADGPAALRSWLATVYRLDTRCSAIIEGVLEAQEARSEVPDLDTVLIEESPDPETGAQMLAFHAPLGRSACEAVARAVAVRLGRRAGRDLELEVADLGWTIRLPVPVELDDDDLATLLDPEGFDRDLMEGLERGEFLAVRFRYVAATGLMVLRRPEGGRVKVGGLLWVSKRLYPLVKACCPQHPLLRETRREVLENLLDVRSARTWIGARPTIRFRRLDSASPFTAAWLQGGSADAIGFEPPTAALERLHRRLTTVGSSDDGSMEVNK